MIDFDTRTYVIGDFPLHQQDESKPTEWTTVGYLSNNYSMEQSNYSATELECYVVVRAILTLKTYLEGSHFFLRTDQNALRWRMKLNDPIGRIMRWKLRLLEFDYEVVYRPGRVHQVPDALSRLERGEDNESDIEDELPTFPVGKESTVEDILHVVQAITRRQTRQSNAAKLRSEAKRKSKKHDQTEGAGS